MRAISNPIGKGKRCVGIGREARHQARLQDAAVVVVFVAQALVSGYEVAVAREDQQVAGVVLHVLEAHAGGYQAVVILYLTDPGSCISAWPQWFGFP